ncbi:hypothetical protein M3Y99_01642400 [Aphelenchoides fujianensis]|nr:hypothetical protein M3Y99_01642400 [Aphelenchoides fujianensis]
MAACRMDAADHEERAEEPSSGYASCSEFNRSAVCSPALAAKSNRPVGGDSAPLARRCKIEVDRRWLAVANRWADSCPLRAAETNEQAISRQDLNPKLLEAVNRAFDRLLAAEKAAGIPSFEQSFP